MSYVWDEVYYYGLKVKVVPVNGRKPYLTGEAPAFKAIIRNSENRRRYGKLAFRWLLAIKRTYRIVSIDIEPNGVQEHVFESERLYTEGTAMYDLLIVGEPEKYVETPWQDLWNKVVTWDEGRLTCHTLCSYKVVDRDTYEEEERRHLESLKEIKRIGERLETLRDEILKENEARIRQTARELDQEFRSELERLRTEVLQLWESRKKKPFEVV